MVRAISLALLLGVGMILPTPPILAADSPSGLPLPRFVTTRSTPLNVRVGPGTRYEVAWVYVKEGVPVEIIQEFDTWRKIRDLDGAEGWVHQNLLSGVRAGYVAPDKTEQNFPIRSGMSDESGVRAYLTPGFRVQIDECDGTWCEVSATSTPPEGRPSTYSGYLRQASLWGVYEGEVFD
jgi:SH3-like domain-containing protein